MGAYEAGSNSSLDESIKLLPELEAFLRQDMNQRVDFDEADKMLTDALGLA